MQQNDHVHAFSITPMSARRMFQIDNGQLAYCAVIDQDPSIVEDESREDELERRMDEWLQKTYENLNEDELRALDEQVEQSRYLQWRNLREEGTLIESPQSLIRKIFEEKLEALENFERNMLFDVESWKKFLIENGYAGYFADSMVISSSAADLAREKDFLPPLHASKQLMIKSEEYF